MKKQTYLFTYILFLFLFACQDKNTSSMQMDEAQSIILNTHKSIDLDSKYIDLLKIVKLETNDHSLLRQIDRMYVDENLYFIFDCTLSKILIFNLEGKYINKIEAKGEGPGEYNQVSDFYINPTNKQIYLLCDRPNKIMFFDYNGNFIREKHFNVLYNQIVADEHYIYVDNLYRPEIKNSQIVILDSIGNPVGYELPLLKERNINLMPFGSFFIKAPLPYYTRRFDNSIYELINGKVQKKYSLDFKQYTLPESIFEEIQSEKQFQERVKEEKYIYAIFDLSEGQSYILLNTNIGIFIIDKIENTLQSINFIKNPRFPMDTNFNLPIGHSNGMFACVYSSYIFDSIKEHIENGDAKISKEYKDFVMNVKEEDNPILFIYQLK
ncbi:6-bladed beta-propeller [Parabacteroides pacaensis]|uniref:6-bladed beta-propeller n=1 Tax=Parabacteroides pacaensis TaxID=2086575 RepID=UPI000D0FDD78|nr:6-bladed beta-propeller [Parabacteroides pacaensis]